MATREERILLPTAVTPVRYTIRLVPDLEKFTFEGEETIHVKVNSATSVVVVNTKELQVTSCSFQATGSDNKLVASSIETNEEAMRTSFTFGEDLIVGEGSLHLQFSGILNDQMAGFYRSKYTRSDGTEAYMATTQFESVDARRAFPCWDEPEHKAYYQMTLDVPTHLLALANMPVQSEEALPDGKKRVTFQPTPVVFSTYLVAFVVAEFEWLETVTAEGVNVRVYVPPGKKAQAEFALEVAPKVLTYFEEYFGLKYPLPKVDLLAIPDFSAGAMENYGLITFRETALLYDPESSSAAMKQRVAYVIAHELAHQWFGNMVTMQWWTDLWLNEGFATWVGWLAVDHLFPDWDVWSQFLIQEVSRALNLDALRSSHPIEVPIKDAPEIDQIFDAISYCKGSAAIRMIAEYLGLDKFRAGLRIYLARHQWGNTVTQDLWTALGEASGVDVPEIMDSWTKQVGYPILHFAMASPTELVVTQSRFLADGSADSQAQWVVPLTLRFGQGPDQRLVLRAKETRITVPADFKWLLANPGRTAFYRNSYDPQLQGLLMQAMEEGALTVAVDRLGLQSDIWASIEAGLTDMTAGLSLSLAYVAEDDYTVWIDLLSNLAGASFPVRRSDSSDSKKVVSKEAWSRFMRKLATPALQRLGMSPPSSAEGKAKESHLSAMLRSSLLSVLTGADEPAALAAGKAIFAEWEGGKVPAGDMQGAALTAAMKDPQALPRVMALYTATTQSESKVRCLHAMGTGAVTKEDRIKVMDFTVKSGEVRSQDSIHVWRALSSASVESARDLFQYYCENAEVIKTKYGGSGMLYNHIVSSPVKGLVEAGDIQAAREYYDTHPYPPAQMNIAQSFEKANLNLKSLEMHAEKAAAWLEDLAA